MLARFLALIALFNIANAADLTLPQPNGAVSNPNYLEFKKTGNTYTWNPVGTTTPPGSGSVSFPSSHTISDVTPKVTTTGDLPYQHKGGSGVKVTITRAIDKAKVAAAAASGLAAAAASKVKPGSPYVTLAEVSCVLLCPFAIEALADWGINQLKDNGDGTFGVPVPDPGAVQSNGWEYRSGGESWYPSASSACQASAGTRVASAGGSYQYESTNGTLCILGGYSKSGVYQGSYTFNISAQKSSCASGNYVVNGACVSQPPSVSQPLNDFFDSKVGNYSDPRAWPTYGAVLAAAIFQSGKDIFTDGTSIDITGPNLVPIGTTSSSTPVNVLPGTTTPAPPGHTGPTDSGTQSTTTTTTATNTFRPGTSGSSGSGSSGSGSGSGPSMSTGQTTQTTTNITNNITNNTSSTVITNTTQTDDAPKEEEKDFCEKNPEALACAELDTPEEEIPRRTLEITFEPEDLGLGRGSCPADRQMVDQTFSYQPTCDTLATYVYPLTIFIATFGALIIIFVGGKAEA